MMYQIMFSIFALCAIYTISYLTFMVFTSYYYQSKLSQNTNNAIDETNNDYTN